MVPERGTKQEKQERIGKSSVAYTAEIGGETTKQGRDAEIPGIKRESQKMSVYGSYAVIIIE